MLERDMVSTVICESAGRQAEDALVFKRIYEKVAGS